jgi:hypothetical protein
MRPHLASEREDWDNLSGDLVYESPDVQDEARQGGWWSRNDPKSYAYKSIDECIRACKENRRCFQYVYYGQTCKLSTSFHLGGKRLPESDVKFRSGWDLERIAQFQEDNSPCKGPLYKANSPR